MRATVPAILSIFTWSPALIFEILLQGPLLYKSFLHLSEGFQEDIGRPSSLTRTWIQYILEAGKAILMYIISQELMYWMEDDQERTKG